MTTYDTAPPGPAGPAPGTIVHASAGQLEWLRRQVHDWQAEGLVSPEVGETILRRYQVSRRLSLGRLMLALGACFVGVGLIWLVAANLDELSPATRFGLVAAFWLVTLVGSEALASRGVSRVVVGAARLVAAFAVGALVFQAGQSLQAPAWSSTLLGCWGAAVLLQAYAFRARGPLLVGAVATLTWAVWQAVDVDVTFADVYVVLALVATAALGVAAVHRGSLAGWASVWRVLGVTLALVTLFVAALPGGDLELTGSGAQWFLVVVAALALVAGLVRGDRLARAELAGTALALVVGLGMVAWETSDSFDLDRSDWGHGIVSMLVYLGFAVAVAVTGTLRDSRTVPALATLGLVVFVAFQSFAVFGQIIDGAWVFLLVGVVFLATGYLFDRARRSLAAALDDVVGDATTDDPGTTGTDGADR